MKFDIVRCGFVTEMTDEQLEVVYGGGGGPLGVAPLGVAPLGVGAGVGVGAAGSLASEERIHSFSFACDLNIFSNNVLSGFAKGILSIANCNTQICANND